MRTEWLEYFADAARLGSIKASADRHFISPQGLSRSIHSLEKELGVKLLDRGVNSVQLTPEAEQLLPAMRCSISANQDLVAQSRELITRKDEQPGTVLCSTFVFLSGLTETLNAAFQQAGQNVSYMQVDTDRMFELLFDTSTKQRESKIMYGIPILFDPMKPENNQRISQLPDYGYAYEAFERHHDGILVGRGHPLAKAKSVSRADIIKYPVISSCAEQLLPLKRYLGASHITMAITDLATRLQMILDNRSIIFLPPFLDAASSDERYRFIKLDEPYVAEVGLIYNDMLLTKKGVDPVFEMLHAFYREDAENGLLELAERA